MSLRSVSWVWAVMLLVAACAASESGSVGSEGEPSFGKGRLVVLDGAGNVLTVDPDGSNRIPITDDAGPSVRYFQPIWSPVSSTIAWGEARSSRFGVGFSDDGGGRETVRMGGFPFYLSWAPEGDRIGVLYGGLQGVLDFAVIDIVELSSTVLDSGSPYYFSWNPNGSEAVAHVGGDRLSVIDEGGEITSLGETRPNYLAPQWTSEGILHVSSQGLTVQKPGGRPLALVTVEGFVSFVANKSGSRVAVQVLLQEPAGLAVGLSVVAEPTRNVVSVLDVATGELEVASDRASLGSFWSPDGERLLMLLLGDTEGKVDVAVWESGETRVLMSLRLPVSLVLEALRFFDQYSQSWQMWAPDSSAFAIPGERQGESGIWVVSLGDSPPALVSDGEWAAWSHQ